MPELVKPPRTLKELVDQERERLALNAQDLMYSVLHPTEYAISIGKYRGVKEFLDRIDEMVKRNLNED